MTANSQRCSTVVSKLSQNSDLTKDRRNEVLLLKAGEQRSQVLVLNGVRACVCVRTRACAGVQGAPVGAQVLPSGPTERTSQDPVPRPPSKSLALWGRAESSLLPEAQAPALQQALRPQKTPVTGRLRDPFLPAQKVSSAQQHQGARAWRCLQCNARTPTHPPLPCPRSRAHPAAQRGRWVAGVLAVPCVGVRPHPCWAALPSVGSSRSMESRLSPACSER